MNSALQVTIPLPPCGGGARGGGACRAEGEDPPPLSADCERRNSFRPTGDHPPPPCGGGWCRGRSVGYDYPSPSPPVGEGLEVGGPVGPGVRIPHPSQRIERGGIHSALQVTIPLPPCGRGWCRGRSVGYDYPSPSPPVGEGLGVGACRAGGGGACRAEGSVGRLALAQSPGVPFPFVPSANYGQVVNNFTTFFLLDTTLISVLH